MKDISITQFIERMPKVELHVHLEGSIGLSTLENLCGRREGLDQIYQYRNFQEFLQSYKRTCQLLRQPEDFELITYDMLASLAEQNIKYAEVFFSPSIHRRNGLDVNRVMERIFRGRERARADFGLQMRLILDAVRQWGVDEAEYITDLAIEHRPEGIIGIGIGGDELAGPPEMFRKTYARAREHGLRLVAHAGEAAGAPSVWSAIEDLGVERIGHGIRSIEDQNLVNCLRARRIPLDISVTSNLKTGIVNSLYEHPIRRLFDAGVLITINSDDPAMFSTTLTHEYLLLAEHFWFTIPEIERLLLNAIEASFLPEAQKQLFKQNLISYRKSTIEN